MKNTHKSNEHEGKVVMASGFRFLIKNGRRLWLDPVPPEVQGDLIYDQCATVLRREQEQ